MADSFADTDFDLPGNANQQRFVSPLAVAWKRKALLILGVVCGVALGILYYSQKAPVYQSTAQMLVVKKRAEALPSTQMGMQQIYIEDYLTTHVILIKSQELLRRAGKHLEANSPEAIPPGADPAAYLAAGLTVTREGAAGGSTGGASNVLNLTFRGGNSLDCAKAVNAIVDAYKEFLNETYEGLNREFLDQMKLAQTTLFKDIAVKQKEHSDIAAKDPFALKANKDGFAALNEKINRLESKYADIVLRQTEIKTRKEMIAKALRDKSINRGDLFRQLDQSKNLKNGQADPRNPTDLLDLLLAQEDEYSQDFGKDHPKMLALRKQIQLVREKMSRTPDEATTAKKGDALDFFMQTLDFDFEENEMMLKTLSVMLKEERDKATETARFLLDEERARKGIEPLQQLYDSILGRMQQIKLMGDSGGYNARMIVEPAAGAKVAPSLIQTLAFATVLGLIVGLALAYAAEWSDKSFHSPEEIRQKLGLPVIGHVPVIDAKVVDSVSGLDPHLCTFHATNSIQSEAFRGLRTSLYFSTQGRGHQVLQITSPHMGDGKSTVAANLAVSIAQSGKSVILIDADFRRPTVHRHFRLDSAVNGLASVISGEVVLADAVQSCPIKNLFLLPCGPRPANPAELLTSTRFQELLNEIRAKYDFVLIDTPPLLVVSDPAVVAPRVDGVILTLRVSKNGRPAAERARELLKSLGAKILGVVVNACDGSSNYGYGYESGYNYGYKYGYRYTSDTYGPDEVDEPTPATKA